jgi:hypothetical protein
MMSTIGAIVGIALIVAAVVVLFIPAHSITPDVIEIKIGGTTFKGGVFALLIVAGVFLFVYSEKQLAPYADRPSQTSPTSSAPTAGHTVNQCRGDVNGADQTAISTSRSSSDLTAR